MELHVEKITENSRFWENVEFLSKEAFPPEEYLAPTKLVEMAEKKQVDFLALTEGDSFVGFMVVLIYENYSYLFFLAIAPSCRGRGYGSCAIKVLKERYPDKKQVVDFEMLDPNAGNYHQRQKRRAFYLRNGYQETGLYLSYLGVDYEVFCMARDFEPEQFKKLMKTVQVEGFNPVYFTR